jgi:hypothetical protein
MRARSLPSWVRVGSALALVLVLLPLLGACTKGGQFDPTELFNSDVFDSKKKLVGQREPLFPQGVPGTSTGVPADLVKGYQPPPDPTDADASQMPPAGAADAPPPKTASAAATPPAEAKPRPRVKPKPKPKLASAPAAAQSQDPIWNQTQPRAARKGPTRISVGAKSAAPAQTGEPDQGSAAQTNWPAPPATTAQTNWPAPPATTAQTNPPSTTPAQRIQEDWPSSSSNASAQKTAQ